MQYGGLAENGLLFGLIWRDTVQSRMGSTAARRSFFLPARHSAHTAATIIHATARCRCMWVSLKSSSLDLLRYCSIRDDIG